MRTLRARARAWAHQLTMVSDHPWRRLATVGGLGALVGFGESATILLVVALVSRRSGRIPLASLLPHGTVTLAGVALVLLAGLAAVHVASARLTARVGADSLRALRSQLAGAYLQASWSAQSAEHAGQLQELIMGNAGQVAFGTEQAANGIASAINLAVIVAVVVVVNPLSLAGLAVIGFLTVAVLRPSRAHARRLGRQATRSSATLALGVAETTAMARDLRAFDVADRAGQQLEEVIDDTAHHFAVAHFMSQAVPNLSRDVTIAVIVVGLALISALDHASLAEVGTVVVLLLRALGQAQTVASTAQQLSERTVNLERIRGFLDRWAILTEPPGTEPCPPITAIEVRHVTFRYPPPTTALSTPGSSHPVAADEAASSGGGRTGPALDDITVRLERGARVGIVGRTGAGKSTLAGILLGVLRPSEGDVIVGGVPLARIDPHQWHRRAAWVPQDPRLLSGTVADNIRFYRPEIDDQRLAGAALQAGLGPELAAWPEGLDHPVGPAGTALSGGQRQRIILARAFAGQPDLIVLDEPTSALDSETEAAIKGSLAALRGTTTVVIIAHRTSTLEGCDRLIMLQDGRLSITDRPNEVTARLLR